MHIDKTGQVSSILTTSLPNSNARNPRHPGKEAKSTCLLKISLGEREKLLIPRQIPLSSNTQVYNPTVSAIIPLIAPAAATVSVPFKEPLCLSLSSNDLHMMFFNVT